MKVFFLRFYLLLEGRKEGGREGEKHQCVGASHAPPTVDLARNPGMCPAWEPNRPPFGLQASTQSIQPHQLALIVKVLKAQAQKTKLESEN